MLAERRYLYVLPVLFLEYLALRSVHALLVVLSWLGDGTSQCNSMVPPVFDRPTHARMAYSLSRALMPGLLNATFGNYTYHVLGTIETVKGILAFMVRAHAFPFPFTAWTQVMPPFPPPTPRPFLFPP